MSDQEAERAADDFLANAAQFDTPYRVTEAGCVYFPAIHAFYEDRRPEVRQVLRGRREQGAVE